MRLAICLLIITAVSGAVARADDNERVEQFTIDIKTNAHAASTAHGNADTHDNPLKAEARATGDEHSDCGEGRASNGVASAEVRNQSDYNSVSLTLIANSIANGGHNVTCLLGAFLRSEDYEGTAAANASAIARITFKQTARALRYRVAIARNVQGVPATLTLSLKDPADKEIFNDHTDAPYVTIIGGPGKIFTLIASISSSAQNGGGCCTSNQQASADLHLSVLRAPIIAEELKDGARATTIQGEKRRIVGGHETSGYLPVGAILINGEVQCTGTLVGPQTVLTAAHCLYTHEGQYNQMEFVVGTSAFKPDARYKVSDGDYPVGDPPGFQYRDQDLTDDVAVLHLTMTPTGKRFGPYAGIPTLASYRTQGRALTFVGYGYDVIAGEFTGLGIKRQVDLPLTTIDNRQFLYRATAKNTCHGDSGGPAFITDGQNLFVAGITSSGDGGCEEYGISMRVDAYSPWVTPRVK
jgi:V8-like Glu-specific endopeptidase